MYEIDFLAVGDGERSGDAIAMRFSHPTTGEHVVAVIDGGFSDDGDAVVNHVLTYYDTDYVDLVVSTHVDRDHICGLPTVLTELRIGALCVQRPAVHGYPNDSGADRAEELVDLALAQGARVTEPFAGVHAFAGAFVVAGPTPEFYEEMLVEENLREAAAVAPALGRSLTATLMRTARRVLDAFPTEVFFDDAGGDNSRRNNGAAVLDLQVDGERMLFTSDVGVPGLNRALSYLDSIGRSGRLHMFQLPHHGSRHNLDRDTLERVLGPHTGERRGSAVASVSVESANPAARVANAAGRRGYPVFNTHTGLCHRSEDAPPRPSWTPLSPIPPLAED